MKWRKTITWVSVAAINSVHPVAAQPLYSPPNPSYQENSSIPIYVPPPESNKRGICSLFVEPAIAQVIDTYKGKWGILVERLADGETIYHYNPDLALIPASNIKILTTAAALQKLDPQTTISSNKSLKEWVTVTNLRSNNYYADTLLKYIGGAWEAKKTLMDIGVNPQSFYLADGSGLSRNNKATPRALVETLRVMYYAPNRDIFLTSLPTAGMSGTLSNRMKQTPVQGIVHAKTGTLTGVRALSGYLEHRQHGTLVFSILANNSKQSGTALVRGIDEIVLLINMTSACE